MVSSSVNTWAVFRFALGYPDERHLERFAELCETVPDTLAELRSLYIDLFEAGLPQPRCPLLESAWLLNRPAGDVSRPSAPQASPQSWLVFESGIPRAMPMYLAAYC